MKNTVNIVVGIIVGIDHNLALTADHYGGRAQHDGAAVGGTVAHADGWFVAD